MVLNRLKFNKVKKEKNNNCPLVWKFNFCNDFLENEDFDINISVDEKNIFPLVKDLSFLNLGANHLDFNMLSSFKIEMPFNYDSKRKFVEGELEKFNRVLFKKIEPSQESFIEFKGCNLIEFSLNENTLCEMIYHLIRSIGYANLYDSTIPIKIRNREQEYVGNLVFWANKDGQPIYIS